MRVLITGAFGFAGRHLIRELLNAGHEVVAFDLADCPPEFKNIEVRAGDIQDATLVDRIVADIKPDACAHLSGISFVPEGWLEIRKIFSINLGGALNILEAFRKEAPKARVLMVSSSEVYGRKPLGNTITENEPLQPDNPYAIAKASADLTTLCYARQHGMHVISARPGNHIGPGQSTNFVAPSLARQVAAIAQGKAGPVIQVGNLDNMRDFTDVRDVTRAYRLLLEKGHAGSAYNIASGKAISIRRMLDEFCALSGVHPEIEVDPKRFRTAEDRPLLDISRIGTDTEWHPEIALSKTLRDIIKSVM